eukprot:998547_1
MGLSTSKGNTDSKAKESDNSSLESGEHGYVPSHGGVHQFSSESEHDVHRHGDFKMVLIIIFGIWCLVGGGLTVVIGEFYESDVDERNEQNIDWWMDERYASWIGWMLITFGLIMIVAGGIKARSNEWKKLTARQQKLAAPVGSRVEVLEGDKKNEENVEITFV